MIKLPIEMNNSDTTWQVIWDAQTDSMSDICAKTVINSSYCDMQETYDTTSATTEDLGELLKDMVSKLENIEEKEKENKMDDLKILDIYYERKTKEINDKYEKETEKLEEKDEYRAIIKKANEEIKILFKAETGSEMIFEPIESRLLSNTTIEKIDELEEKRNEEIENLDNLIEEIEARLELAENSIEAVKILEIYEILDKNGKISV